MTESNSIDLTRPMDRATHQSRRNDARELDGPNRCAAPHAEPMAHPASAGPPTGRRSAAATAQALPRVKAAAQRRLQRAADAIIARLIGFALDNGVPDDIALKAVIAAADRAGFSVKTSATLEVSAKPYEIVLDNLDNLTGGSRAEFRRSQGIPDNMPTPALAATTRCPLAIVTEGDELIAAMRRQQDHGQPDGRQTTTLMRETSRWAAKNDFIRTVLDRST